jgi:hypothetical protein
MDAVNLFNGSTANSYRAISYDGLGRQGRLGSTLKYLFVSVINWGCRPKRPGQDRLIATFFFF